MARGLRLPPERGLSIDLFCQVIDNFGDAGVCWRLARQLSREHGCRVRLIIDQPEVLARMLPALARRLQRGGARHQKRLLPWHIEGVTIIAWRQPCGQAKSGSGHSAHPLRKLKPADAVISAFGCDLPADYRARMRGQPRFMQPQGQDAASASRWINLEYLSAEPWVDSHHLLTSPKNDGLLQTFFFPGFSPATGGLLRERDLLQRRQAFGRNPAAQDRLARDLGLADLLCARRQDLLLVFVFCYRDAPVQTLLEALVKGAPGRRIHLLLPEGMTLTQEPVSPAPEHARVHRIPPLPQARFDEVLWWCDLSIVRGEDSLVRAVWAGRPMLWQPYPQAEAAHLDKLEAFLRLRPQAEQAPARAWNQAPAAPPLAEALRPLLQTLGEPWVRSGEPALTAAGERASNLAAHQDLASQLMRLWSAAPRR